jgi:hypothetical protein
MPAKRSIGSQFGRGSISIIVQWKFTYGNNKELSEIANIEDLK